MRTPQFNRHGISARPARNGVLAALACDLPAAVLADFLGIHVSTAARDADLGSSRDYPKEPGEQDAPA